jgi:hypothetical protein
MRRQLHPDFRIPDFRSLQDFGSLPGQLYLSPQNTARPDGRVRPTVVSENH